MPTKAPSPCSYPGCGQLATDKGRCDDHPRPHKWGERPDERERYGLSSKQYRKLKHQIAQRDNHRCYRCGAPAHTLDHIQPLAEGGAPADPDNCGMICGPCHDAKSGREIARSNRRRARTR